MAVDIDYRVDVNVSLSNSAAQVITLDVCLFVGIFPSVAGFTTRLKRFDSYQAVSDFFTPLLTGTATSVQNERYKKIIGSAYYFFAQSPSPEFLYIGRMDPSETYADIATVIQSMREENDTFYAVNWLELFDSTNVNDLVLLAESFALLKKKLFVTLNDQTIVTDPSTSVANSLITSTGANRNVMLMYHSTSFPANTYTTPITNPQNIAAAFMGAFFTPTAGFPNAPLARAVSYTSLQAIPVDPTISSETALTSALGVNATVYTAWGASDTLGVPGLTEGKMASSSASAPVYLDTIIGMDYLESRIQTDLFNAQNNFPQFFYYDDDGIQYAFSIFKTSIQACVTLKLFKQFSNSDLTFLTYDQCALSDIANRIYRGFSATLTSLSHIERIKITVGVQLA